MLFQFFLTLALALVPLALAVARSGPPSGAIVVRKTGTKSGEFSTISAAVASLSGTGPKSIFVYAGTYNEQVSITYSNLTILGQTTEWVTSHDLSHLSL